MSNADFTEQREDLLESIEVDEQAVRVALCRLTDTTGIRFNMSTRIENFPLSWALGAFLVGAWLGTRQRGRARIARGRA